MEGMNPELDEKVMEQITYWKGVLRRRCERTGLEIEPDRIAHFVNDDFIYILANPIIAEDEIYDAGGYPTRE